MLVLIGRSELASNVAEDRHYGWMSLLVGFSGVTLALVKVLGGWFTQTFASTRIWRIFGWCRRSIHAVIAAATFVWSCHGMLEVFNGNLEFTGRRAGKALIFLAATVPVSAGFFVAVIATAVHLRHVIGIREAAFWDETLPDKRTKFYWSWRMSDEPGPRHSRTHRH